MDYRKLVVAGLAGLFLVGATTGCSPEANEQKDVKEAQDEVNEERREGDAKGAAAEERKLEEEKTDAAKED